MAHTTTDTEPSLTAVLSLQQACLHLCPSHPPQAYSAASLAPWQCHRCQALPNPIPITLQRGAWYGILPPRLSESSCWLWMYTTVYKIRIRNWYPKSAIWPKPTGNTQKLLGVQPQSHKFLGKSGESTWSQPCGLGQSILPIMPSISFELWFIWFTQQILTSSHMQNHQPTWHVITLDLITTKTTLNGKDPSESDHPAEQQNTLIYW